MRRSSSVSWARWARMGTRALARANSSSRVTASAGEIVVIVNGHGRFAPAPPQREGTTSMSTSHLADEPALAPPYLEEVSPGVYAYIQPDGSWFLNNTAFLVGRDGVVSIDTTSTERRTRDYLRSEEHTSELQSRQYLVCRLLLEKK